MPPLAHGADVNDALGDGSTPLLVAAQNGHHDVGRLLIAHKADVDASQREGWTLLYLL